MNDTTRIIAVATKSSAADDRMEGGSIALIGLSFLALFGLYAMSHAEDGGYALFGATLAGFSVLMLFRVIALMLPHQSGDH